MSVKAILVDARNYDEHAPVLKEAISKADFIGLDTETHDDRRHDGLNRLCRYDDETRKKSKSSKLVFDMRRTDLCGVSFYAETMGDTAYYLNIGHADVENRLNDLQLADIMAAKRPTAFWVAHNAAFEMCVFAMCLGMDISAETICTLQMAVSAYGPQEYDRTTWLRAGRGTLDKLVPAIAREAATGITDPDKMTMSPELSDLVFKIISKSSKADHSWNGFVNEIAYGYGLKKAVKSHFGVEMTTFEEVLGDDAHMGQLTGAQVVNYGADDAYWAMRLFRHLMAYMVRTGGMKLVSCFFEQENPMVAVYAEIRQEGMRVNADAIRKRTEHERAMAAQICRDLKAAVRKLLPFSDTPNADLLKYDAKWYANNHGKYRQAITEWANSPDSTDDFTQAHQVRGPVSNAWAEELRKPESTGPNFSHYMPIRVLLYDLVGAKPIRSQGKVQSDGEARGKIRDKLPKDHAGIAVVDGLNQLAGVEQRMKLFLQPYSLLTDPETDRLYPEVSSMLATRRMAASNPNPMQLAKRGESTYVRGFFEADYDDHVIVSLDWSAIELVEIGEFSADPEFIKAFGQIPHQDMHSGAAASILAVDCPGLTEARFKSLKGLRSWDELEVDFENLKRLQTNVKGEQLGAEKAYGYWRTEVGKGANFNYWYSGWLATIGERLGWDEAKTKAATEAYRERFWVAEQWRVGKIEEVQKEGFITLHDGHRYVRYEATADWYREWVAKFCTNTQGNENYDKVMRWIAQKIAKRAGNQTVNCDIQGSCATIAKRSVLRIRKLLQEQNWGKREARFMVPIHDELVFSVHRDLVVPFIHLARGVMIDHPDMFKLCKLDSTPAVGRTFEPWNSTKAKFGQIELYEAPREVVGETRAGKRLDDDGIREVVDYLFSNTIEKRLAA